MWKEECKDPFLAKRLAKYDAWLNEGKVSFSSRVIPVLKSLSTKQWVLPTAQVMEILRNANSRAVQDCVCRSHYKRCDKPLDVCLLLNDFADKFASRNLAHRVSFAEAADVVTRAAASGLIHLTLYRPDHEIYALCNCCSCCCHDLQILSQFKRKDLVVHAEYIAHTASEVCNQCGKCVEVCVFGARVMRGEEMEYNPKACLGCGLCVTACSAEAIFLTLRQI